jgi:hypothetical protein
VVEALPFGEVEGGVYRLENQLLVGVDAHFGIGKQLKKPNTIIDFGCGPFGLPLANQQWKKQLAAVDPLLDEYAATIPFFNKKDYPETHFVTQVD